MVCLITQCEQTVHTGFVIRRSRCAQQVNTPCAGFSAQMLTQQHLHAPSPPLRADNANLEIGRCMGSGIHLRQQDRKVFAVARLRHIQHRKTSQLLPYPCSETEMGSRQAPAPHLGRILPQEVGTLQTGDSLLLDGKDCLQMFWPTRAYRRGNKSQVLLFYNLNAPASVTHKVHTGGKTAEVELHTAATLGHPSVSLDVQDILNRIGIDPKGFLLLHIGD